MQSQTESIIGAPEPRHFPIPMARFGLNPFGENLWRIVFAPTVHRLIGGKWKDGSIEYRLRPTYRDLKDKWILEKWISAFEFCQMTEGTYNFMMADSETGMYPAGPYPHRGTYFHVHTFESVQPGDCNLEWIVGVIAKAKNNDPAQVKQAIDEHYSAQERARKSTQRDQLVELRPSFGTRPTSLPGGGVHTTKTFKFDLSAADLKGRGMPVGRNKAMVKPSQTKGDE
jgi:hypothetical protein